MARTGRTALLTLVAGVLLASGASAAAASSWRWSPQAIIDVNPASASPHALTAMSCPSRSLCVGGDDTGDLVVSREPNGGSQAWTAVRQVVPPDAVTGVSCPSTTFCAVVAHHGDIATSTDPRGGRTAWKVIPSLVGGEAGLTGVSCPSRSLCVAVGGREVAVSTRPTGGRGTWKIFSVTGAGPGDGLVSVSCATPSLCVALNAATDEVFSSTHPSRGRVAWKRTRINTPQNPPYIGVAGAVSCPTRSLCVVAGTPDDGSGGYIASSTDPTAGTATWKVAQNVAPGYLTSVSCPSSHFCVADGDPYGEPAVYATNPAGGARAWKTAYRGSLSGAGTTGVSCASSSLCVLFDSAGDVIVSADPTRAVSKWTLSNIDAVPSLESLACPGLGRCYAGDTHGDLLSTADPATGPWTAADIDNGVGLGALACHGNNLCVAGDNDGNVLSSTAPAGGVSEWHLADINSLPDYSEASVVSLACPASGLCVGAYYQIITALSTQYSSIISSVNPAGGAGTWRGAVPEVDPDVIEAVSCPSSALCIGVDDTGHGLSSTTPTNHSRPWRRVRIDGGRTLSAVSCPTASLCVAVDRAGDVVTSARPTGRQWKVSRIDGDNALTGVACPSQSLCVAVDGARHAFVSSDPTGGVRAWKRFSGVDGDLIGVACPSVTLCVAADSEGGVVVGRS
jgi:hypothetical protein